MNDHRSNVDTFYLWSCEKKAWTTAGLKAGDSNPDNRRDTGTMVYNFVNSFYTCSGDAIEVTMKFIHLNCGWKKKKKKKKKKKDLQWSGMFLLLAINK